MAKPRKKRRRRRIETGPCPFCVEGKTPDYKEYKHLVKYVSDRGKIKSSEYTGVCATHQRRLSEAIKRARHLALLPFAPSL